MVGSFDWNGAGRLAGFDSCIKGGWQTRKWKV